MTKQKQNVSFYIKDQDQRNKVLSIFCYEVNTLLGVYIEKHKGEVNFPKFVQIATSESMLVHLRNLIDYFFSQYSFPKDSDKSNADSVQSNYFPNNTTDKKDYIAESLIEQDEWKQIFNGVRESKDDLIEWANRLNTIRDEINTRISHITDKRRIGSNDNTREYYEYIDKIIDLITLFLDRVADVDFDNEQFKKANELVASYKALENKKI